MDLDEIPLEGDIIDVFRDEGIRYLYPPQKDAMDEIFRGNNLVVSIPTASGKSLIAYMAILRAFKRGLKSVYIVPLRALAMEKYDELKRFEKFGMKVALSMGDYDSPAGYLKHYDVVVATSEKMDSILRHDIDYAYEIGVVVADEIHLLGEESRGPTLEMVLTKLKTMNPEIQFIGLSATIKNSDEIASWLEAKSIYSEFRPVPLKLGVYHDSMIRYDDGSEEGIKRDALGIGNLVTKRIEEGGQLLIFVNRRKSAESLASKLQYKVGSRLSKEEKEELEKISSRLMDEEYTIYTEKIAKLLVHGVAFHHAGLSNFQRRLVEDSFKNRLLKVIVATPTLAAGINLPSRTVIVRDLTRYDGFSSVPLPVMEVRQMLGRAGRPKYDRFGEGIIFARSENKAEQYFEMYIKGEIEDIRSRLENEHALRVHTLALIASDMVNHEDEILNFFRNTFYGFKMPVENLEHKIDFILDFLEENEFIERKKLIRATKLGKRVSDLYIDPESAIIFRKCYDEPYDPFCILHTISCSPDMRTVHPKSSELNDLFVVTNMNSIAVDEFDVPSDKFFGAIKTSLILQDWMNEIPQDDIVKKYDIGPGDLHSMVEIADWLLYAFAEIGKVLRYREHRKVEALRMRVKYGVREELLPIVSIRGIGRVRARRLFDYGFDSITKLRNATISELTRIPGIGEKLAREIIKQL